MAVAGTRAKNALHIALYDKALRLPVGSGQHGSTAFSLAAESCSGGLPSCGTSTAASVDEEEATNEGNIDLGLIMNLASEDILNVREFIWNIHYLWALPMKVLVLVGLLYMKMGVSGASSVVLGCLLIVPLQFFTGKLMSDNNKRIFAAQDTRMFKSTEAMQGMKSVKLGCLEEVMLSKIEEARNLELKFLRRDSFCWSIMAFLASISTVIVTTATVGLYVVLEEGSFSASNLFSALALLGQLTVCLSVFPVTIPIFIKGAVSRDRLVEFFSRPEATSYKQISCKKKIPLASDPSQDKTTDDDDDGDDDAGVGPNQVALPRKTPRNSRQFERLPEIAFEIKNGIFAWPKTTHSALKEINLEIKSGTLTMVVGPSGCGKTALISCLVEEMDRMSGELKWYLPPSVALMGQRPWLMNASVKDNILLGRPFREKRYRKVLEACDLNTDIDLLPDGDETEVGERGVLLSGGQRQRLSLARCLYSKAACTFLDAPFSSLDAKITHHIFHKGIMGTLLKRKRTVFMSTDRLDFLENANKVLYLKDGKIIAQGTVHEVLADNPELHNNLKHMLTSHGHSMSSDGSLSEGKTAQERWRMLKNVTRLSIHLRQVQRSGKKESNHDLRLSGSFKHPKLGMLSKKKSVNALAISQLRMNSSSQLNLCHDILLPSDELSDASSYTRNSVKKSRHQTGNTSSGLSTSRHNSNNTDSSGRGRMFSRALSWTTNLTNSLGKSTPQSQQQLRQSSVRRQHSRRQLMSVGSSSSMLIRNMAVTGVPRVSGDHADASRVSSVGGPRSIFKRPPEQREFSRMRSFHHALMSRKHFGGSHSSLPKQSNSEPDSFSIDMQQMPLTAQQPLFEHMASSSRSSSRQSSYSQDVFSTSSNPASHTVNPHHVIMRMTSNTSAISGFSDDFREDDGEDDGLILSHEPTGVQEKREYGEIGVSVYKEYLMAGGVYHVAAFLVISVAMQAVKVYMDFLLRDWSLDTEGSDGDKTLSVSYFYSYSMYSLGVLALSCMANLMGQLIGARARRRIHARMLQSLMHCPIDLLEACPIGRVINRFSYDMFVVDQKLPSSVQRLVLVSLICFSALAVNAIQSPAFLLCAIPLIIFYWCLQHFYRASSRELQRLESISRAPVLSHFSDSLSGLVTIRAFGEQQRFINELCEKVDANTTTFLVLQSGCRWLGVALDFVGAAMVFASVIINLISSYHNKNNLDPEHSSASVGLSMNYSLLVPIYLAWVVKFMADIENYMNAVERILEYTNLEAEESEYTLQDEEASQTMEELKKLGQADIRFDTVGLAHSLDMRAVIQSLNLEIPAGQRVAIVGRSGSGKTTLLMGLSR